MDAPLDRIMITVSSTHGGTTATVAFSQNPYNRKGVYTVLSSFSSQQYLNDPVILLAVAESVLKLAARRVIQGDQEVS
jgi:hypothetical protein